MGKIHVALAVSILVMFLPSKCISMVRNNITDQEALLAFKAAVTFDPQNLLASNWTTETSICNWVGITCSRRRQRVTALNLPEMGLVGTIPPQLGNLSFLCFINVTGNQFYGHVPHEIANLHRMKYLIFSTNNLTGTIPYEIFNISSMVAISFTYNSVYGNLPRNMCDSLPNLGYLHLSSNQLSGHIPSGIWKCRKLQSISLSGNNFEGTIPEEVGYLPMLRILFLGTNNLTGHIPQSILNMSSIQNIDLSYNSLSGPIPARVGNVPNLQHLMLQYNNLTGHIPASVFNISTLLRISLDKNRLSGSLPTTIGNLRALQILFLQSNFLTNDPSSPELNFFTSLSNCRALIRLRLESNLFSGVLPPSIGNLTSNLTELVMDYNNLTGNIPSELGNLSGLIRLSMTGNNFTGAIPETVTRMENRQLLDLSSNKLKGSIPSDICLASSLSELYLNENTLSGPLPDCIGLLTSLRTVVLDSNALSSSIPLSLWSLKNLLTLSMRSNSLNSSLPSQVGEMTALVNLDLSGNHLYGDIPSNFGKLGSLQGLFLQNNEFEGTIPESLSSVKSLEQLDLSYNNLSGSIPKSLEELVNLWYFNVSFNELEGEIPTSGNFLIFIALSFMSNKALCGPPRLQVPPCSTESHGHTKIKSMLSRFLPALAASLVLMAAFIFLLKRKQRRQMTSSGEEALSLAIRRRISYLELLRATSELDESNLLGKGSFGSVYQGILSDGLTIAVKVFDFQLQGAFRSFDTECEVLRYIRHRNLAKIICSCSNPDFKALVLHYMPNGNLEKWLYCHNYCLHLIQRLNIMIDVASALEYLHHGNSTSVVHCDLKPSNVLLDEDMVAHVCDFGIAKLFGETEASVQTRTLATIGYMAPEYGLDGVVSTKTDVYSFGIMLMEFFSRRKPTDEMFGEGMSLTCWVQESTPSAIMNIADTNMVNAENGQSMKVEKCLVSVMELALQCTHEVPGERMNMIEILARLRKIKVVFLENQGLGLG